MQWIVIVFVIGIAVVSAIVQAVKNQKEKEPPPRRRTTRNTAEGVRTGSSDMDRFLQEIEKLRKRSGGDEPRKQPTQRERDHDRDARKSRAVPTVTPTKRPRRETVPTVAPTSRIERLPEATVVPPADESPITRSAPQPTDQPTVTRTGRSPVPATATPFGKELLALLANRQSLPMAVALQEILGPPKCKQV